METPTFRSVRRRNRPDKKQQLGRRTHLNVVCIFLEDESCDGPVGCADEIVKTRRTSYNGVDRTKCWRYLRFKEWSDSMINDTNIQSALKSSRRNQKFPDEWNSLTVGWNQTATVSFRSPT